MFGQQQMGQTIEQLKSMMQAEKKAREHDYGQAQGRIRELEEQLAEFEEEHINLQNKIYEQKVAQNKHETHSQISMHKESVEVDGNHPDSLNNSPVPSKNGAAAPQQNPAALENDRVKELMSDLLHMRKRLKKEEEQRRQFMEIARKKEEEIKKLKSDI